MLILPYKSTIPIISILLLTSPLHIILIANVNLKPGILVDLSLFILIRSSKIFKVYTKAIVPLS
jgi:hypothetical protein